MENVGGTKLNFPCSHNVVMYQKITYTQGCTHTRRDAGEHVQGSYAMQVDLSLVAHSPS